MGGQPHAEWAAEHITKGDQTHAKRAASTGGAQNQGHQNHILKRHCPNTPMKTHTQQKKPCQHTAVSSCLRSDSLLFGLFCRSLEASGRPENQSQQSQLKNGHSIFHSCEGPFNVPSLPRVTFRARDCSPGRVRHPPQRR